MAKKKKNPNRTRYKLTIINQKKMTNRKKKNVRLSQMATISKMNPPPQKKNKMHNGVFSMQSFIQGR